MTRLPTILITNHTTQRQHSANVLEAPKSYPQQEPAKAQNILTMDCRGLEFVDFKADVSLAVSVSNIADDINATFFQNRANSKPRASSPTPRSQPSIYRKASGMTTTTRPVRK